MLIPDRENVIKAWEDVLSRDPLDAPWDLIDDTLALLKELEPVVRCKDCKYWHDAIRCQMDSEGLKTPENWFCADGERR